MRKHFPGHFRPNQQEFDELWNTALIVPDSNILLHILRYGEGTRKQVLDILRAFNARVWIPHQVGFEFLNRWRDVDAGNRAAYDGLKKELKAKGTDLAAKFRKFGRHQIIDPEKEIQKIDTFIESLCEDLDEAAGKHPTIHEAQSLVEEIADIINDSIGPPGTDEQAQRWAKEAEKRYAKRTPPGYMDVRKNGDEKYGDFFLWEQMIAHAKETSLPVIFVSDDRKEDWVHSYKGEDIGPRPELVNEFFSRTGQRFYSYSFKSFLMHAQNYVQVNVSSESMQEIERDAIISQHEEEERIAAELETARSVLNSELAAAMRGERKIRGLLSLGIPDSELGILNASLREGLHPPLHPPLHGPWNVPFHGNESLYNSLAWKKEIDDALAWQNEFENSPSQSAMKHSSLADAIAQSGHWSDIELQSRLNFLDQIRKARFPYKEGIGNYTVENEVVDQETTVDDEAENEGD